MNEPNIPTPLIEAVKSGRVVLFLGAGASLEARSSQGARPPTTKELGDMLAKEFLGESYPDYDLMSISELAIQSSGENVVFEFIRHCLRNFEPSVAHKLVPTFKWHTIATTNYDTLLEDAYATTSDSLQNLVPFVKDREPIETKMGSVNRPVMFLKLHGCIEHAHDQEIPLVLDASHYERFKENRNRLFERLIDLAHELPFLFIGYRLGDSHIRNLFHRLDRIGISRPTYYVVAPNVPLGVRQSFSSLRINVIDSDFSNFIQSLDGVIPVVSRRVLSASLSSDLPIRKHFRTNADPSEALATSLDKDIEHVHPSMPVDAQNPKLFYKGYDSGFGAIAGDFDARRRASNDLMIELIDHQPASGVRACLLRGPGGSGKTIALKRTAWETAKEFDAPVFFLREHGKLRASVFSELYRFIGKRLYVFIDRAAEHLEDIIALLDLAKVDGVALTVIMAERDTAWNTESEDFDAIWGTQAFTVDRLFRSEVEDLISRMGTHSALGVLTSMDFSEQVAVFEGAGRHLLVALHEVTQGKPFEKIVIDECNALKPRKAQELYKDICTLHQFEAPVRAGVINRVSSIPFTLYEKEFFLPLEGVVISQQNPYSGDFEYKSRHPHIASLVFKQAFSSDEERASQLIKIITSLDEGYQSDHEAMRHLIKARNLLKLTSDIVCGRSVYREILKHLGEPWYVWQQRAIFELHHDSGSIDDAENFANKAVKLKPDNSSAKHTLAEVARIRAQRAETQTQKNIYRQQAHERLGNMRLSQNEPADSSKCKLLLDEMEDALKQLDSDNSMSVERFGEISELTRDAIEKSIVKYPTSAEIQKLRADFYKLLRENDKARRSLEKAWNLKPKHPGIAIQLSRLYIKDANYEAAEKILQEATSRFPMDHSANFAMAKFLFKIENMDRIGYYCGKSYSASDRNYYARYFKAQIEMYLGDGDASKDLFTEVDLIAPRSFQPKYEFDETMVSKKLDRIEGRIVSREETFVFISSSRYPANIYGSINNSEASAWPNLKHLADISFRVGFNRLGPVALDIQPGRLAPKK